jgi:alginate O-acetyltransferase complex protein AlgI
MRMQLNIFITMLLGGLWHGANWTFVLWGAYHGLGLVVSRLGLRARKWPRPLAVAGTFVFVVLGWVLFRSESVGAAFEMYRSMAGIHGFGVAWVRTNAVSLVVLAAALGIAFTWDTPDLVISRPRVWGLAHAAAAVLCVLRLSQPSPFLYFQF